MDSGVEIECIFWTTIIGGVVYMMWARMRARRLQRQGECARCGDTNPKRSLETLPLCDTCAGKTGRNHLVAYRFFLGGSIFCSVAMTLGTICDLYSGIKINWQDVYPMFGLGVGLPLVIALWIRHQCRLGEYRPDGDHS